MGVTYDELSVFGRLRKVDKCGPYSTFTKLVHEWGSFLSPVEVSIAATGGACTVTVSMFLPSDRGKSQTFLLRICSESPQDDNTDAGVPCCK
jgi:hypothetical protein